MMKAMPTPLNVLMLEDNPDDAELILLELDRAGFAPTWRRVETETDFLSGLSADLDIILADFSLFQLSDPNLLHSFCFQQADIFVAQDMAFGQ